MVDTRAMICHDLDTLGGRSLRKTLFWTSFLPDLQHRSHLGGPEIGAQKKSLNSTHTHTPTDRSGLDLTSPRTHSKTVKNTHLTERSSQNGLQKKEPRILVRSRINEHLRHSPRKGHLRAFSCFSKRRLRRNLPRGFILVYTKSSLNERAL